MSAFIESLRRKYKANTITLDKLNQLLASGSITAEEYDYIIA